jgi:uncharacterized protein YndB with AHSA1/START domain
MAARKEHPVKAATEPELVITRELAAPRAAVFKAWTRPERFVRWWGPNGFTTPHCRIDLRLGGVLHFCMRSPDGHEYWGRGVFREIVEPERLAFTDSFSDEQGNVVEPARYGMSPEWPVEALVTVSLSEHKGKTTLTLKQSIPVALADRYGAREGWTQSLERLADFVEQAHRASAAS